MLLKKLLASFFIGSCCVLLANAQPIYQQFELLDSSYNIYYKGEYDKAGKVAFQALREAEDSDNALMEAEAYRILGEINRASNNRHYAIKYLDKAEKIFSRIGNDYGVASTKNRKAALYMEATDTVAMRRYLGSSLKISRDRNFKELEFNNLTILGGYHSWIRMDYVSSIRVLKDALAVAESIKAYQDYPYIYINLCHSFRMSGMLDSALIYAKKSLKYAKQYEVRSYISRAYAQLSLLYGVHYKDFEKAWEMERLYVQFRDTLFNESREKAIAELVESYKTEIQEKELDRKDSLIQLASLGMIVLVIFLIILFILNGRLKKRRKQVEESKVELENLNSMKDRLLSVLSHDLRSPVATLQNVFELLSLQDMSKDELEQIFGEMQNRVLQTGQLLDNLLTWIRSQVNSIEPKLESLSLRTKIEENIALIQPMLTSKSVGIELHVSGELAIQSDREMIKMIVRNILNNAVKYSKAGGTILIQAAADGNRCKLEISDQGIGIEPEVLKHIFNLQVVSKKGTNEEVGAGIGLTLVKEFADLLDLNIEVHSRKGEGTTFTLYCPLA